MHPQLVAGAWVGFNDNRVTMGSRWGQGAQSALPIVGEFYRLAIKGKVVDQNLRFAAPRLSLTEPQPDPQLDANGQPLADPNAAISVGSMDPSAPRVVRPPAFDAGAAPEGSWQPAPVIRYITVQEQGPPGAAPLRDLPPLDPLRP